MKNIIFLVLALTTLVCGQAIAQTAQQHLNSAIQSTENIKLGVIDAEKAVNQLTKEITIIGNPNAVLLYNKMFEQVATVQNNADDTDYFTGEAKNASVIPFSTQPINTLTADLVSLNDELIGLTYLIDEALNSNNNNVALNYLPQVKATLTAQNNKSIEIINTIQSIKQTIKLYNVCVQTVDYQGNPVPGNDLHGFWAQNLTTGEYIYPTNQDGNCFENLPDGTYRFDSYNGYWSGTSSTDITLSESQENSNGIIIVNLTYWSE